MNIRKFAKSVGFTVVGKLRYMGKWNLLGRYYRDDAQNTYILFTGIGTIKIIPRDKD